MSEVREGKCICGNTFEIPIKRGRPPVRCSECREAYSNGTLPDRLHSLGIDHRLAMSRRINSDPSPNPQTKIKEPQRGAKTKKSSDTTSVEARLDSLEGALKAQGKHISQHRDNW